MTHAIGYVRVSSQEQATEGVSLDAQVSRIRQYAQAKGFDLTILREEGVSAGVPLRDRPEGAKLVTAIAKKRVKHVIAIKLDRLFRSTADCLQQIEVWNKTKCAVHILDMAGTTLDTSSAMGKMIVTMFAGFAELERNLIGERTKTALAFKKASDRVYTRIAPLGFDRHGDKLVPNKDEMKTVRRILRLRADGLSMQAIADAMNEAGAATKLGGTWHAVTVQKVLKIHAAA